LLLISCTKDPFPQEMTSEKLAYVSLNLEAAYVVDNGTEIEKRASSSRQKSQQKPIITTAIDDNFYSEFSIEESSRKISNSKSFRINKLSAKEGTTMPTDTNDPKYKKVEQGIKYMVMTFGNEDNHIGTTLATVGEETRVPVKYKEDYEFSIN